MLSEQMLISFTTRERAGGGEGEGFPRMSAEEQGQCVVEAC